jgi:hypothetical protein
MSSPERQLGVDLYNEAWRLMESREDDDRLLYATHASAYHWLLAPEAEPKNRARGEWQISRVYSVLGRPEPALHHAQRCLDLCEEHADNVEDWDTPFAYEALARAHKAAGNEAETARFAALAREAGEKISDREDRDQLDDALATL